MRRSDLHTTRELADRLLSYEDVGEARALPDVVAAVRVCDRLRQRLALLVGPAGFRSLLTRALSLAQKESPALGGWVVNEDGSLQVIEGEGPPPGVVLVAHLIGLMITFIGDSLTLRILHDVWLELPDYKAKFEQEEAR